MRRLTLKMRHKTRRQKVVRRKRWPRHSLRIQARREYRDRLFGNPIQHRMQLRRMRNHRAHWRPGTYLRLLRAASMRVLQRWPLRHY